MDNLAIREDANTPINEFSAVPLKQRGLQSTSGKGAIPEAPFGIGAVYAFSYAFVNHWDEAKTTTQETYNIGSR